MARLIERQWPAIAVVVLILSVMSTLSAAFNVTSLSFNQAYAPLFGDFNILRSDDDKSLQLLLNRYSGSGFVSKDLYHHGLFSASIKLPANYTAGVVVAFYASNGDVFEKTHDELDFEFLGNIRGKQWRIQTNVYGNGSTNHGREERYLLWFDPSKEFHRYSILWTSTNIIFYVDDVPIREVVRTPEMGLDYPSKPMQLYATIWDGSSWATSGGRYKANYAYAPFVSEFTDLVIKGCAADPIQLVPSNRCTEEEDNIAAEHFATISAVGRAAMQKFRLKNMIYSHCYDRARYPTPLPECTLYAAEQERFKNTGHLKFNGSNHRHRRRRSTSITRTASRRASYV